jgi:magnesium chelatase family protein
MGELALDGHLKPVKGVLSAVFLAQQEGFKGLVIPRGNLEEASLVSGIASYGFTSLGEIIDFLRDPEEFSPASSFFHHLSQDIKYSVDFQDVRGQHQAKRALEIAAAGSHNVLMVGPPGAGKTMLARRLPSILPPMSEEEIIEVTRIYSVAGLLEGGQIIAHRPFRSPHHSVSAAGLIGGGTIPRPGEVSLAHRGVLFLDELSEYKRHILENLRQPLEDGCVTICRLHSRVTFPSSFMLVAAMNSFEDSYPVFSSSSDYYYSQKARFYSHLSKPLLDRIDLQVEVPKITFQELNSMNKGEPSPLIRKRVVAARQRQIKRFKRKKTWNNSQMNLQEIKLFCQLDKAGRGLMERAMESLNLSARAYVKILKVARTIADLEGDESSILNPAFLAEAIQYRLFDRDTLSSR